MANDALVRLQENADLRRTFRERVEIDDLLQPPEAWPEWVVLAAEDLFVHTILAHTACLSYAARVASRAPGIATAH